MYEVADCVISAIGGKQLIESELRELLAKSDKLEWKQSLLHRKLGFTYEDKVYVMDFNRVRRRDHRMDVKLLVSARIDLS